MNAQGGGGLPAMPDIFSNRNPMDIMATADIGLSPEKRNSRWWGQGPGLPIGNVLEGIFKPKTYDEWRSRHHGNRLRGVMDSLKDWLAGGKAPGASATMSPRQNAQLEQLGLGSMGVGQGPKIPNPGKHHTMTPAEFMAQPGMRNLFGGMGGGMPGGFSAPGYGSLSSYHYTNGRGMPVIHMGGGGGFPGFGGGFGGGPGGPGGQPFIPPWGEGYRKPGEPIRSKTPDGQRVEVSNPGMGERMQGPWQADNRPPGGWNEEARDRGHTLQWSQPSKRKWWKRMLLGAGRGGIKNMKQGRNSLTNWLEGILRGAENQPYLN